MLPISCFSTTASVPAGLFHFPLILRSLSKASTEKT
uniref:Uncharacterized protein n=1 Tax=Rhizophora mucronata TaxID=61149 RepID=A0A2P2JJH4_RHIMU